MVMFQDSKYTLPCRHKFGWNAFYAGQRDCWCRWWPQWAAHPSHGESRVRSSQTAPVDPAPPPAPAVNIPEYIRITPQWKQQNNICYIIVLEATRGADRRVGRCPYWNPLACCDFESWLFLDNGCSAWRLLRSYWLKKNICELVLAPEHLDEGVPGLQLRGWMGRFRSLYFGKECIDTCLQKNLRPKRANQSQSKVDA